MLDKGVKLQLFFEPFHKIIDNVQSIKAHIHRITFTTNYNYNQITESLGQEFRLEKLKKNPYQFKAIYEKEGSTKAFGFNIHIKTGLKKQMRNRTNRFSMITIVPDGELAPYTHRFKISKLHRRFKMGDVKISKLELAFDLFLNDHKRVRETFKSFLQIAYRPYITDNKDIFFRGNQLVEGKRLNIVYYLGMDNKIYERGKDRDRIYFAKESDGKKQNDYGWHMQDLDRIRFERTLTRRKLSNLGISTFHDLFKYKNNDGLNILHNLIDHFQFRYIKSGPKAGSYMNLMEASLQIDSKNKNKKVPPINHPTIISLKSQINDAIYNHSNEWFII
jgi:hypothetical protein